LKGEGRRGIGTMGIEFWAEGAEMLKAV